MSLTSLPVELLMAIAKEYGLTKREHRSLAVVSRNFSSIFTPALYANITIGISRSEFDYPPDPSLEFRLSAGPGPEIQLLLDQLESSLKHRNYIRSLCVLNLDHVLWPSFGQEQEDFQKRTDALIEVLLKCQRLQLVRFQCIQLDSSAIFQLASRKSAAMSIALKTCRLTGSTLPRAQYTATSLECSISEIESLYPLIFGGSLEHFILESGPRKQLALVQSFLENKPTLIALTHISFETASRNVVKFFNLTPNVVSLHLEHVEGPSNETYTDDWKRILPRLESYSGPSYLIPQLVTGRPINSLASRDDIYTRSNNVDVSTLGENFGSTVPIIAVHWADCLELSALLNYIITRCRCIENFGFYGFPRHVTRGQISSCIQEIKKMKLLRTLRLKHRAYYRLHPAMSQNDLRWEKSICHSLQAEGSPQIWQIQFPSLTIWSRDYDDIWRPDFRSRRDSEYDEQSNEDGSDYYDN